MSQTSNLYQHMLDVGPITPLDAFRLYGILACHSRINELRERGIDVETKMIRVGDKMVGQYSISKYPQGAARSFEPINGTATPARAKSAPDLFESAP